MGRTIVCEGTVLDMDLIAVLKIHCFRYSPESYQKEIVSNLQLELWQKKNTELKVANKFIGSRGVEIDQETGMEIENENIN